MGQLDRMKEARRSVQQAALQRWLTRVEERESNKSQVAARGVGAADSPQRNARFQLREATLAQAREMSAQGRLPFAIERKMGPTLDYVPYPTSETARKAGRPVARIVLLNGPGTQPEGIATGFMVSPRLLLTNHHVFPSLVDAAGVGAHFLFERSDRGIQDGVIFEIDAGAFYVAEERLDLALVAVKERSVDGRSRLDFGSVALIEGTSKILIGEPINIIQHPEGGPKQYAVTQNRLVDLLDDGFLHYETDTLEGSSGSPAFSKNWELVGLHHASIPEYRDGRVIAVDGGYWDQAMGDDKVRWVANEGIRVSAIVKFLSGVKLDDPIKKTLLHELLTTTADPVDEILNMVDRLPKRSSPDQSLSPLGSPRSGDVAMAHNRFNFSGPVQIHVYSPAPITPLTPTISQALHAEPPRQIAAEAAIRFDRNYKKRDGYSPDFLDVEETGDPDLKVAPPEVLQARLNEILKDKEGDPLVLKYHHFELVMNEQRRLQMWSAANVDYHPNRKLKGDRKSFGSDKWIPDPRIPETAQIFDSEFYKPAGNIDRGHIVRREDNAWGDDDSEIEFSNSDTFHWTNCTPQHEAFNQSAPGRNDVTYRGMKGLWGDFENYIQKGLGEEDTRACIFAGPILDPKDPSEDFGAGDIQYPLSFWKVVIVAPFDEGKRRLHAYGFLLSQADVVKRFGIETFRPGRFRKYQVSLERITKLTGVEFAGRLHQLDPLHGTGDRIDVVDGSEIRGARKRTLSGKESIARRRPTAEEWPRPNDEWRPTNGRKGRGGNTKA